MNSEELLEALIDIDNATEISNAILSTLVEYGENENINWMLIAVEQQIDKIRIAADNIDSTIRRKAF